MTNYVFIGNFYTRIMIVTCQYLQLLWIIKKMLLVRKWLVQVLGSGRCGAKDMAVTKITENKKKQFGKKGKLKEYTQPGILKCHKIKVIKY